jgi:hypothetical protein
MRPGGSSPCAPTIFIRKVPRPGRWRPCFTVELLQIELQYLDRVSRYSVTHVFAFDGEL